MTADRPADPADEVELQPLSAPLGIGPAHAGAPALRLCPNEVTTAAPRQRPTRSGSPLGAPDGFDPRTPGRPLRAVARVTHGPVPLDFQRLAARIPAVRGGLVLAGEADLELHPACVDQCELRAVVADLRRAGAARVQVELVLRRLVPSVDTATRPASVVTLARSAAS
ncbi:hypothetical protein OG689_02365 [Kitasatospora sp. NBC_00240]|uniref:hypothetical protein n=1 Tax=Kitasatospora sp. NBC_00240 TaxID=2903567 RepID=UPI00225B17D0|nr:hypothetical protein [Kitasatospora sp. NBC_00240]MCX5208163.1 hypothetical protein [Kitasatospora sp. NBC_00240]